VDRKVDALRIITDRRAQEVSSAQARRATRSLGLLAALGLVTLVIASFGYFFGSADPVTTKDRFLPLQSVSLLRSHCGGGSTSRSYDGVDGNQMPGTVHGENWVDVRPAAPGPGRDVDRYEAPGCPSASTSVCAH